MLALVTLVAALVMAYPAPVLAGGPILSASQRALAKERPIRVGWPVVEGKLIGAILLDERKPVGGWGYEEWTLMAIQSGVRVEHVLFDSIDEEVAALKAGTIDVVGAIGPRPALVEFATPTTPLAWDSLVYVGAPADSNETTELQVRRVTTGRGSGGESILARQFPSASYVPTGSLPDALDAVATGKVDLFLATLAVAGRSIQERGLRVVPIEVDGGPIEFPAWTPRGSRYTPLVDALRATLTGPQISEITRRWTGFDLGPPSTRSTVPRGAIVAIVAMVAALSVAAGVALLFRRRVRLATEQLREANETLEARVMVRTAELHLKNAALVRFGRSIAHDLRNPITVIGGLTRLLRQHDLDGDAQARILESIERSAAKLDEMISAMLTDAVQSGSDGMHLDGGAYEGWLRGAVAAEVLASGADLQVRAPDERIDVDAALLLKASLNLVGNALKYAANPTGMRIDVGLVRADSSWILTVDDNGPGLGGSSVLEEIFDRGYRSYNDDRGQGWGLADVRDLARAAGGSISAGTSSLGGAHFSVVLPGLLGEDEAGVSDRLDNRADDRMDLAGGADRTT